jgi:KipI family sensor histidine kinase inhibitor
MSTAAARFLDAGEAALVVEFGTTVDPQINARVLALDAGLRAMALPGVRETVPTYRSLMIHYEPLELARDALVAAVRAVDTAAAAPQPASRWIVPCCYDPAFGEDIAQIAEQTGLAPDRVVALHAAAAYRVYMYGFAPGFCYLGGLPEALAISRRATPRPPHPPNTVIVGGGLSLITTIAMPTGWWLVGRTPERMFALGREPVFLVEVGDALRFEPIDRATFDALEARAAAGEIVARRERRP